MGSTSQINFAQFTGAQYANNPANAPIVGDLLYHALRIAGVMQMAGRGYSIYDYQDSLWELNQMISNWKAQQNMVYAILRTVFAINIGQGGPEFPYLIGTSGLTDIPIERPQRIEWASYIFTNVNPAIEQPFIQLTAQEWAALSPKDLTSGNPTQLYYEPAVPNGKIYLFPVPANAYVTQGALYTWQTVSQFLTPLDPIITPPAYVDAMQYNLALRIAARYGPRANLSPLAVPMAGRALALIKSINAPPYISQCERGDQAVGQSRGNFNILSNMYVP